MADISILAKETDHIRSLVKDFSFLSEKVRVWLRSRDVFGRDPRASKSDDDLALCGALVLAVHRNQPIELTTRDKNKLQESGLSAEKTIEFLDKAVELNYLAVSRDDKSPKIFHPTHKLKKLILDMETNYERKR